MNPEQQKLADLIRNGIEEYAQKAYDDGHRNHLGASIIGEKCNRKLWFTFRWVYHHIHSGRMQRLFNTGHKEEERIIEWLKGYGFKVVCEDNETGKQFKISDVEGHFGGSLDGIFELDDCYLLECKTNKTGPEFKALFEIGMEKAKPKHWSQTCVYGNKKEIKKCLYICKNKDNDDLYIEILDLDWNHGQECINKAKTIIYWDVKTQGLPSRISESSAYWECKNCDYLNVCFNKQKCEKNCRSCISSKPVENGEWYCEVWNSIIPKEAILNACDKWKSVV